MGGGGSLDTHIIIGYYYPQPLICNFVITYQNGSEVTG